MATTRTRSRSFLVYAVWAAACLLGGNSVRLIVQARTTPDTTQLEASYVPYTVVREDRAHLPTGKVITFDRQVTFAVASDGSYAERIQAIRRSDYRRNSVRRTIATPEGIIVRLDDLAERKSTFFDPSGANRIRLGHAQYDCMKTASGAPLQQDSASVVRKETLKGHRALVIRGNGGLQWYAPDLGCALLQTRVDFGTNGVSDSALVSVTSGEPTPALFEVPAHYKEVLPSVLAGSPSPGDDAFYRSHRPLPATPGGGR